VNFASNGCTPYDPKFWKSKGFGTVIELLACTTLPVPRAWPQEKGDDLRLAVINKFEMIRRQSADWLPLTVLGRYSKLHQICLDCKTRRSRRVRSAANRISGTS
jgi:hypothetical protein